MDQWATILASIAVLVGVAEVYAKTFGPVQAGINEAAIQAFSVPSKYRPLLNYGISILVAAGATVVVAASVGAWEIVPGSIVVGALAAGVAASTHDTQKALTTMAGHSQTSEVVGEAIMSPAKPDDARV